MNSFFSTKSSHITSSLTNTSSHCFSSSHDPEAPPVVKPNSFSLLHWGLFFHPCPNLPSWARITYLSPLLPLQPGRGNHTSLSSQRSKSTACVPHPHSQGGFHRRKKALVLAKSSLFLTWNPTWVCLDVSTPFLNHFFYISGEKCERELAASFVLGAIWSDVTSFEFPRRTRFC